MGFLDWIIGKRRPDGSGDNLPESNFAKAPKAVTGLDDETTHYVFVEHEGGTVTMMDKDAYDYVYGRSQAPNPSQRDLDELLPQVTRVRCLASGMLRGNPTGVEEILDLTDAHEIAALHRCLAISEDASTFNHCMCMGAPTLVLYAGKARVATIGMQHGHAIRWNRWKHDATLVRGPDLIAWFARNGVGSDFLNQLFHNQYGVDLPLAAPKNPAQRRAQTMIRQAAQLCRNPPPEGRDQAFELCGAALEADPDFAYAFALRADIHQERGQFADTVADATTAIDLGLQTAEVYLSRAVAADLMGNLESAQADCDAAIEIDPNSASAFNSRGLIKVKSGDGPGAIPDCRRAVELAPHWPVAHLNLGLAHMTAGDSDSAMRSYDEAIRLDANFAPAGLARAEAFTQRGDIDLAIDEFSRILEREPLQCVARLGRGDAHVRRQQYDDAIADYTHVAKQVPELAERMGMQIVMIRAHACHEQGDYQQAIDIIDEHLDSSDHAIGLYAIRASAFWYRGDLDDAVADFTKMLLDGGPAFTAYSGRGQVYAEQGSYEEALDDLTSAVGLAREAGSSDGLAYSLNGLGLALGGVGRLDESFATFSESLKLCPGNAWAYYNRAKVFQMAGDPKRAAQDFARALKQDTPRLVERLRIVATEFLEEHAP